MKKFFTLLSLLIVMGMSANIMAQSTGETPAPGATHSYSVTGNTGSTYTWSVTAGDLTTPAGDDATITGSGASVSITWASTVAAGNWYYVHVVEADGSCTNEKVLPVQITASNFYVSVAADNATACYNDPVSVSLDGNTPEYSHGDVTLTYTITPSGVNATSGGYEFDFDLNTNLPTGYTAAAPTVSSGSATISGSTITVSDINAVTLEFVVTNGNTYTNANDGSGIAADFTATLSITNGVTGNGVSDNTSGTYSADTNVSRPHTSEITTD